jgi:UDP-N-acetylmuramate: L-alanyl-gamma-D-glutamyl-meso-diaminopimelate ligase
MVKLTDEAQFMVLEGDEYLSSPIDRRPKFHLYKPDVAIISGIAWDHINVFPTFENYVSQFDQFCSLIKRDGLLIYNEEDKEVNALGKKYQDSIDTQAYSTPSFEPTENGTKLSHEGDLYELKIFGSHNLQNLMGAMHLATQVGISSKAFLHSMVDFSGAGKRLQKVIEKDTFVMYKDFAHSPSKLKATTNAVKEQYPNRRIVACMELHTFSSLKKEFLPLYDGAMNSADEAIVYFSHEVVKHKKLDPISKELVADCFGGGVSVLNNTEEVLNQLKNSSWKDAVLIMMSSGNFDGIDYDSLGGILSK